MLVARVIVDVMLKPEILDPQGRAVQGALGRLGLSGVADVRQGKQFVIELEGISTTLGGPHSRNWQANYSVTR